MLKQKFILMNLRKTCYFGVFEETYILYKIKHKPKRETNNQSKHDMAFTHIFSF